jgi:hypothetical protein
MVCEAYIKSKELNLEKYPYEILSEQTGEHPKVCYRAMERASRRGFVDYGCSLRTGWVTPQGEALLNEKT